MEPAISPSPIALQGDQQNCNEKNPKDSCSLGDDEYTPKGDQQKYSKENPRDSCSLGDEEYTTKVRKAYTITRQRQRWGEEEHTKFLEALKLYGRSWRLIQEHIGTKTTVQIRSHAQKFFSKVIKESSDSGGGSSSNSNLIVIPPPRPKRQPKHPYPRKIINPPCRNPSVPEQEQPSASSITSKSTMCNGESSADNQTDTSMASIKLFGRTVPEQEHPSSSSITSKSTLSLDNQTDSSMASIKLFGRTVLITYSHRPSSNQTIPTPTKENPSAITNEINYVKMSEEIVPSGTVSPDSVELRGSECEQHDPEKGEEKIEPLFGWNMWDCSALPLYAFPQQSQRGAESGGMGTAGSACWPSHGVEVPVAELEIIKKAENTESEIIKNGNTFRRSDDGGRDYGMNESAGKGNERLSGDSNESSAARNGDLRGDSSSTEQHVTISLQYKGGPSNFGSSKQVSLGREEGSIKARVTSNLGFGGVGLRTGGGGFVP